MKDFRETRLWQDAFVRPRQDASASEQTFFQAALLSARDNAKILVARIASDMPGYTVHDITHLDALWRPRTGSPATQFHSVLLRLSLSERRYCPSIDGRSRWKHSTSAPIFPYSA